MIGRTAKTETAKGRKAEVRILTRNILVVATHTFGRNWKAFIGIVPGRDHDEEWEDVIRNGDTLAEDVARFLFPSFDKFAYDR